ncbi:MAG TPA: hypothetical protein DCG12_16395 [Planctomycetaceae bacterium]|nr:hypothetical protein [Planctomycetaceae bacterium]
MRAQIIQLCIFAMVASLSGCGFEAEVQTYKVESEQYSTTNDFVHEFALPEFDSPKGWKQTSNDEFSKLAFEVGTGANSARVTVTKLGASIPIAQHVSRWAGQIKLQITEDTTPRDVEWKSFAGHRGLYVHLEGPREAIAGAIVEVEQSLWFFKMRGSVSAVDRHAEEMKEFCNSTKNFPQKKSAS